MNLTIENYIFFHKVMDEDKKVAAKIKSIHFLSTAKKIIDIKGKTIYTTDIINSKMDENPRPYDENRRYVIYQGQRAIAIAFLSYVKYDNKNSVQPFILRPPQVEELYVQTYYGELSIKRQKGCGFVICDKVSVIGNITSRFPFRKYHISCDGIDNPAFLAALYVLVKYMVGEDNFIIF